MTPMRTLQTLTASLFATVLAVGGMGAFAASQDPEDDKEKTPLHETMEKVTKKNAVVIRGVRTASGWRKSKDDVIEASKELITLGEEAKGYLTAVEETKQPKEKWEELMDSFIKEATTFSELASKEGAEQKDVKDGYKAVTATCTSCHEIFRPDDF